MCDQVGAISQIPVALDYKKIEEEGRRLVELDKLNNKLTLESKYIDYGKLMKVCPLGYRQLADAIIEDLKTKPKIMYYMNWVDLLLYFINVDPEVGLPEPRMQCLAYEINDAIKEPYRPYIYT